MTTLEAGKAGFPMRHFNVLNSAVVDPVSGFDLEKIDLVSLDVFDTLLMRKVEEPSAVFDVVATAAINAGLMDPALAGSTFRQLRQGAERAARATAQRRTGSREVLLPAIYEELAHLLPDPAGVAALEVAVEAQLSIGNPVLRDWLEALHARHLPVVLMSDMYLPADAIATMLAAAGIGTELYRALYVSGEQGCSKLDGGLFAQLKTEWSAIPSDRMLHIGDDPSTDVAAARKAGLRAMLYQPSPSYASARERESQLVAGFEAYQPARRLAALSSPPDADDITRFWHDYGALVLGPAIAEYCLWVVEDCRRRGIPTIVCFWREGAVFAPLMRDYAARRGWPLRVECLAVSRQALAPLAFLDGLDGNRAHALLHRRPHLPWDALLREALGDSPDDADWHLGVLGDLADLAGLTLDGLLAAPPQAGRSALDRVLARFDDPALATSAVAAATSLRDRLCRYAVPIVGNGPAALVDLGARGTTAAALSAALAATERDISSLRAYLCYSVDDVTAHQMAGLRVSVYAGTTKLGASMGRLLYRSPQMHERLLTGLEGTTLGYAESEDGEVTPLLAPPAAIGDEAEAIADARRGIAAYWQLRMILAARDGRAAGVGSDGETVDDPLAWAAPACVALLPLYASVALPTPEEAQHLGNLQYDQNDGSTQVRKIVGDTALEAVRPLVEGGAAPLLPLALGLRPAIVPWPQGALTCLAPTILSGHHDAVAPNAGHAPLCRAFVERLRNQGVGSVILLAVGGEGGMGSAFLHAAQQQGLSVVGYIDLMPDLLDGPLFHGIPVLTPGALVSSGCRHVALATLGYAAQARGLVEESYATADLVAVCYTLQPDGEHRRH